ncbi:hypothetical protein GOBAR_AA36904 [Gossypium barbadense]|uniref:Uncharacterized protein n=1 Tax=Gossypium barbadense TaxID=3634 RepID=A0A2P5VY84_GOSBA|nr:hypothetical protein GOBAR_AA36904 [Gossypium barbadense]
MELCSTFHLQTVMTNYYDPGMVQFRLGGLVCQLSVPEFGTTLGLYMEEFKEENGLHALNRHIHRSPSRCWDALDGERALASSTLTTLTFLWCMLHGHVIDLAYFIALAIQHQKERHRKGVISIGPYVTRLARHFGRLSTSAQESSLTLIGQMSIQGISSMLTMRMLEKCRGTYPPQYRLAQSTEEEAYEDIPDDVPPQHEDPPTQPPPPSCPVHAAVCEWEEEHWFLSAKLYPSSCPWLLYIQETADDRPTMSDVVSMLSNESLDIPPPKQPASINATSMEKDMLAQ